MQLPAMDKESESGGQKIRNTIHYPTHMAVLMDYLCCGNYTKGFECGNGWSDKETAAGL